MSETKERRRFPRATINFPVTVLLERRPIPGNLVDISQTGVLFSCRAPVEVAENVSIQLSLNQDQVKCQGSGHVVRRADDRSFGVKFAETSPSMTEFVNDLLKLRSELRKDFLGRVINPMVVVSKATA